MELQRIKIFGERNTGTRAVAKMLRPMLHVSAATLGGSGQSAELDALEARIRAQIKGRWLRMHLDSTKDKRRRALGGVGAWKHAAPVYDASFEKAKSHIIFMVRDPYSWVISFAKHPYHIRASRNYTLEGFLDMPWLTIDRDRLDGVLESPLSLWNQKLAAYQKFSDQSNRPCAFIRFEDFVADPVLQLGTVLTKFGIATDGLELIEESTKNDEISYEDISTYYRDNSWRQRLTKGSVSLINQYTDWELAKTFGYERLNPDDFPDELPSDIARQIAFELSDGQKVSTDNQAG